MTAAEIATACAALRAWFRNDPRMCDYSFLDMQRHAETVCQAAERYTGVMA